MVVKQGRWKGGFGFRGGSERCTVKVGFKGGFDQAC